MKRKFIYLLSSIFVFGNAFTINAQPNIKNNTEIIKNKENTIENTTNLKEKLKKLDDKYDNIELIFNYNEIKTFNNNNVKPLLEFETIEEFEKFLENNNNENKIEIIDINKIKERSISSYSYNGVETIEKWKPLNIFNFTCYLNMDISYTYDYNNKGQKYFISGKGVNSYTTGLTVALDWVQTSVSQNVKNSGKTLESEVKGYWINGIKIGDIELGFKDKRTYLGVLNLE